MQDEMVAVGRDGLKCIAVRALVVLAVFGLVALASEPAFAHDTVYYFMTDALHSTVVVTDQNRNIVEETHYSPYGLVLNRQLRDGPGYGGHTEDPATGLVYMQQRYYDPQAGRFISTDPVLPAANGSNFNRYWYANDNPYRYTDPDGRKCSTVDGKASCTFDEFKDKKGNIISRQQALSSGSKLAKFFHVDSGHRILHAEAAMTTKYVAAKNLAAHGGHVTIEGDKKLGVPDQTISGSAIVSHMESIKTIASAQSGGITVAGTPAGLNGAPSPGPITFYEDGAKSSNLPQTFGHEILHTIYSGVGVKNYGWANPSTAYNIAHQIPFDDASDEIH